MRKAVLTWTILAALALGGCGKSPAAETAAPAAPAAETIAPTVPARQNGERFDTVIMLEGMEETVHYEHVRRDDLGFEMDYDYEGFRRYSDAAGERFVSTWDDQAKPENYLELRADTRSAELVAADVSASLSNEYDLITITRELERAGSCTRIEASVIKGTNNMAEQMQAVYIIPAPDGCVVATEHSFIAESEGMWHRFEYMLHTLAVFPRSAG